MGKKTSLNIVPQKVDDLIPYVNNARTHSESQVLQIAASIKEFGFNNPILIDGEKGIIAGHGRLLAAKKLGLKTVPCVELRHLTELQKKAFILADNRIAENASWDDALLRMELGILKDFEFDLESIGFDDFGFEYFPFEEGETDAEAEWTDMPEYQSEETCHSRCVVKFASEQDRAAFFSVLGQKYTEKTLSAWYPVRERRNLEDLRWADE